MAAWDHLSPDQFAYHGTYADLKPGDMITTGRSQNFDFRGPSTRTYFTESPHVAQRYANYVTRERGLGETPRVYQVEPTGPYKRNAALAKSGKFYDREFDSGHPLRVVGEQTS